MDDHEIALKNEIKSYEKLAKINDSDEVNELFELLIRTCADKMIWTFTTGKEGDNVKSWDDFCKVRGEIIARLQPIQDVRGSKGMVKYLREQLKTYYDQRDEA